MDFSNLSTEVPIPFFIHYKNKPYRYHGVVKHSETLEELVYYETRYENKEGAFWVRPKQMFFENHSSGVARFKQQILQMDFVWSPSQDILEKVFELGLKIFVDQNPFKKSDRMETKSKWLEKLKAKKNIALVCAKIKGQPDIVGFKLGFSLEDTEFYTWLGGVDKGHRNLSIATGMQKFLEVGLLKAGFVSLKTKCSYQWTEQMCINLKNGFSIQSVNEQQEISFQKKL